MRNTPPAISIGLSLILLAALAAGCAPHPPDYTGTTEVIRDGITYIFPDEGIPAVSKNHGVMNIVIGHDDIRNDNGKLIVNGTPYGKIKSGDIVEWHANRTITINQVPQDDSHR